MDFSEPRTIPSRLGAQAQDGSGDHDQPYHFGRRPRASAPYPFSTRQYARLLILRSRFQADPDGDDVCDERCWPPAAA
jgi:hypothetical protein